MPNEVIKSPYLTKVIEELDLPDEEAYTPLAWQDPYLFNQAIADSTIIKIEDKDPKRASDIVNTVARLYTDFVREKIEVHDNYLAFLREQRESTQASLDEAQRSWTKFARQAELKLCEMANRLSEELHQWRAYLAQEMCGGRTYTHYELRTPASTPKLSQGPGLRR